MESKTTFQAYTFRRKILNCPLALCIMAAVLTLSLNHAAAALHNTPQSFKSPESVNSEKAKISSYSLLASFLQSPAHSAAHIAKHISSAMIKGNASRNTFSSVQFPAYRKALPPFGSFHDFLGEPSPKGRSLGKVGVENSKFKQKCTRICQNLSKRKCWLWSRPKSLTNRCRDGAYLGF